MIDLRMSFSPARNGGCSQRHLLLSGVTDEIQWALTAISPLMGRRGVSEMGERVGRDCECAWFGFEVGVG